MWSYNLVSLPETQKQTFEQWRQFMRHKSPEILAFIRCCRSITWSEITIWSGSDFWSQSVIRLFELSCNRCQVIGWWWETGITSQEFLPSCIACLTFLKQQDVRVLSHHVLGDFKGNLINGLNHVHLSFFDLCFTAFGVQSSPSSWAGVRGQNQAPKPSQITQWHKSLFSRHYVTPEGVMCVWKQL